jgi:hypothetical protein
MRMRMQADRHDNQRHVKRKRQNQNRARYYA